ncbi:MAG: hypothetical protein PHI85_01310 [Victivallaceae bacterium]|nr:hypothetical protein [Victivallaceae bacterium]
MRISGNGTHHARRKISCNSFTLLELMLAVVVLVVVLSVVSLSFRTVVLAWRNMSGTTGKVERMMALEKFADEYLRGIVADTWEHPDYRSAEPIFKGDASELFAAARRRTDSSENPGMVWFRVFPGEDDGILWLESATSPFFPEMETEMPRRLEKLADNIEEVVFSYVDYDAFGELDWHETWLPEDHPGALPAAIMMTLTWKNGEKNVWLRRLAGVQQYMEAGK